MKNLSRNLAIAASLLVIIAIVYYFIDIVAYVLVAWVFRFAVVRCIGLRFF